MAVEKADTVRQAAAPQEPAAPGRLMGAAFESAANGVRVREVEEDSPAAAVGLQSGDLITALNRTPVSNSKELEAALKASKGQSVLFLERDGRNVVLVLP